MAANDFRSAGNGKRSGLMDTIREKATSGLSSQKDRAADGLSTVVEAVRQSGQQLRDKNPALAGYADNAATMLDRWASDFRAKDVSAMVDDVKRFARQRPAVFLGGAVVLGVVAARLVKSAASGDQTNSPAASMGTSLWRDEFGGSRSLSGGTTSMDIAAERSGSRPSTTASTTSRPRV